MKFTMSRGEAHASEAGEGRAQSEGKIWPSWSQDPHVGLCYSLYTCAVLWTGPVSAAGAGLGRIKQSQIFSLQAQESWCQVETEEQEHRLASPIYRKCPMVTLSAVQMLFLPVSSPQSWVLVTRSVRAWVWVTACCCCYAGRLLRQRPGAKNRVMITENFHQQTQNLQCSVIIQVGFILFSHTNDC